jgi:hypothetical protein
MAKRRTNARCAVIEDDPGNRRAFEAIPVLTTKDYLDQENPDSRCLTYMERVARETIEELARQIRYCCSDKKWTSYQKRVACDQLVNLVFLSTGIMYRLAGEFPEPFRQIAEELSHFPCLFPASVEELRSVQKVMWDHFNLGKRHELKLRGAPGRKTFSQKTWANRLLIHLIHLVHESARCELDLDPGWDYGVTFREVAFYIPLTPQNAKQWFDVIWKRLLMLIPEPEKHPRLRQLVVRPSLNKKRTRRDGTVGEKTHAHNIRASIRAKLGLYFKRIVNDSAVHK